MKIVLVLPDQTKLEELQNWWYPPPSKRKGKPVLPTLGMLYLCAAIQDEHEVIYIDNSVSRLSDEALANRIVEHNPAVVGFGGTMQEWPQAASAAALVKKMDTAIVTVYGGPNATARPEKHIHYFDFVFRGMAELSLKEFLNRLDRRQSVQGIDGLCAKTFDKIAAPAVVNNLDTLPWPDRSRIDLNRYQRKTLHLCGPTDVVITSRGCPFDCRFCSSQFIWDRRYLKHSVDRVIDEVTYMKERYGSRSIHFREDNLTVDRKHLAELCKHMEKLGLQWTCQSRVNSLNEDIVRMMKASGCRLISCGFESINDSTLQYLRKRQTSRQILNAIEIFEKTGMHYTGAYIVATPNEGKKEIVNTIRFARQVAQLPHSLTPTAVSRFVGIPVSELYFQIIKDGLVEYDWQHGELLFPRTYQMSSQAIDELIRETYAAESPDAPAKETAVKCDTVRTPANAGMPVQLTTPQNNTVTVLVRTVGERTENVCYERLAHQVPPAQIRVIRERPFTEALRKTFEIGLRENRKWTCVVDADILVTPRIIEKLVAYAETLDERVFSVIGQIIDKFLGGPKEGGIHLYRTKWFPYAIEQVPTPYEAIRPELFVLNAMKDKGFPFVVTDVVTGLHDYEQYYRDIYRKCFIHAKKHSHKVAGVLPQWQTLAEKDADFKVALAGVKAGFEHHGKASIDTDAPYLRGFEDALRRLMLSEKTELSNRFQPSASSPAHPHVSVVMAAFNAERFIGEAMESVLAQRFGDFELLVVDDGSTDNTVSIVESYNDARIRLIRQPHKNFAAAMNRGIQESRGEFVMTADSDDRIEPDYLRKMTDAARACPGYAYYYPEIFTLMDEQGRIGDNPWRYREFENPEALAEFLLIHGFSPIPNAGSLKRRSLFARTGLYRDLDRVVDYEFLTRNALNIRFKRADGVSGYLCRIRPDSISRQMTPRNKITADAMEAMLTRYSPEILCPSLKTIAPQQRQAAFIRYVITVFSAHAKRHAGRGGEYFVQAARRIQQRWVAEQTQTPCQRPIVLSS